MNANIDLSQVTLTTERLILRPWQQSDLEDFYAYASVEGVGELAGWVHHQSIEETKTLLEMFLQEKKTFALCLKSNNQVIGSIGLEAYDEEKVKEEFKPLKCREVGYVLSKEYWGCGIMHEALNAVIDYCFHEIQCDALFLNYYERNHQSKRIAEKCGFIFYKDNLVTTRYGSIEPSKMNVLYNRKSR